MAIARAVIKANRECFISSIPWANGIAPEKISVRVLLELRPGIPPSPMCDGNGRETKFNLMNGFRNERAVYLPYE
jgi:hypothetical protein